MNKVTVCLNITIYFQYKKKVFQQVKYLFQHKLKNQT